MSISSSSSESDYADRDIDDIITTAPRKRAKAISAEADAPDPDYKPPVHFKTDEEKARIDEIISGSFLFNSLETEEKALVINAFEKQEMERERVLIREGEEGDCLYIVDSGSFDVFKAKDGDVPVNMMGQGSTVGELALMYSAPRAATVVAREPSLVWKLDRATFTNIVKGAAIKKRDRLMQILHSIPLLQGCDQQQLIQFADAAATCEVSAENDVVRQGEPGDSFFILLEGAADAIKNNQCVLHYAPGDFFGELALLNKEPRAATVRTTKPSKLIRFDVESFNRLLSPLESALRNKEYSDLPIT